MLFNTLITNIFVGALLDPIQPQLEAGLGWRYIFNCQVSDHNLRLMRLDDRELGIRSPHGKNGGTPQANGFGTISTEIKENLKIYGAYKSLFSKITEYSIKNRNLSYLSLWYRYISSNFETISLAQNSL